MSLVSVRQTDVPSGTVKFNLTKFLEMYCRFLEDHVLLFVIITLSLSSFNSTCIITFIFISCCRSPSLFSPRPSSSVQTTCWWQEEEDHRGEEGGETSPLRCSHHRRPRGRGGWGSAVQSEWWRGGTKGCPCQVRSINSPDAVCLLAQIPRTFKSDFYLLYNNSSFYILVNG